MIFKKREVPTGLAIEEAVCLARQTTWSNMMNPNNEDRRLDPLLLDNIEEAADILISAIDNNADIVIVQDSDVDGVCSTAILYNYIAPLVGAGVEIPILIHDGKGHGLTPQILNDLERLKKASASPNKSKGLVILPDASSNDYLQHKQLFEDGYSILVIDHHDCEKYSEHAVVVNNQLSKNYPNKDLCGAGVVYQLCRVLDDKLNLNKANNFLDLVAVANVADMMNATSPETRYLIDLGLKNIQSTLLRQIMRSSNKESFIPMDVAFSVAPLVNAVIRVSDADLKRRVLKSVLVDSQDSIVPSNKRGFGPTEEELVVQVLRNANNAKAQQKRQVSRMVDELLSKIDTSVKPIVAEIDAEFNPTLIGLVANMLANQYQCPAVLLRENTVDGTDITHTGSQRAYGFDGFKDALHALPSVVFAEGHQSASGVGISNLDSFKEELLYRFNDIVFDETYEYDFEFNINQMPSHAQLLALASLNEKSGQGFPEIRVKISNVNVKCPEFSTVGSRNNTIRGVVGKYYFVKFFTNEAFLEQMKTPNGFVTNLYCSVSINEYEDARLPQLKIDHYEHSQDFSTYVF